MYKRLLGKGEFHVFLNDAENAPFLQAFPFAN